jgi:putative endonuclease
MASTQWFVYIILNSNNHLYTGITTDLVRRFKEHSGKSKGAKFFRTGAPVRILYSQKFTSRSSAQKFEIYVKGLSRQKKWELIEKN